MWLEVMTSVRHRWGSGRHFSLLSNTELTIRPVASSYRNTLNRSKLVRSIPKVISVKRLYNSHPFSGVIPPFRPCNDVSLRSLSNTEWETRLAHFEHSVQISSPNTISLPLLLFQIHNKEDELPNSKSRFKLFVTSVFDLLLSLCGVSLRRYQIREWKINPLQIHTYKEETQTNTLESIRICLVGCGWINT